MADNLVFYTNPMSRGRIGRWMLEEVGQPYDTVLLDFATTMKAPDYLALNPMGKVPAIRHGDTVVTECAAICAYLADALPQAGLAPPTTDKLRGPYYRWLFFTAGPLEAATSNKAMGWEPPADKQGMFGYGSLERVIDVLVLLTLTRDFSTWVSHALHHRIPLLWEFHKVHHSAEVLTPATVFRKHPVYNLISEIIDALLVGPVQGCVLFAFGVKPDPLLLFGGNAIFSIFHLLGSNVRHSHIWWSFGPVLNRILISPAQHQVHHSKAPQHWDRNFGEAFALWDWMFGTLYLTGREPEPLEFGILGAEGQEHPTLWAVYTVPFVNGARLLRGYARGKAKGATRVYGAIGSGAVLDSYLSFEQGALLLLRFPAHDFDPRRDAHEHEPEHQVSGLDQDPFERALRVIERTTHEDRPRRPQPPEVLRKRLQHQMERYLERLAEPEFRSTTTATQLVQAEWRRRHSQGSWACGPDPG